MESFGSNKDLFNHILCELSVAHTLLSKRGLALSVESLMAWCMEDLLPQMHMTADMRIAKDSLHLNSQPAYEGAVWHVTF